MQDHCMPRELFRQKQVREAIAAGKAKKAAVQGTLDTTVTRRDAPPLFNAKRALEAIAQYIVCKDVVSDSSAVFFKGS